MNLLESYDKNFISRRYLLNINYKIFEILDNEVLFAASLNGLIRDDCRVLNFGGRFKVNIEKWGCAYSANGIEYYRYCADS